MKEACEKSTFPGERRFWIVVRGFLDSTLSTRVPAGNSLKIDPGCGLQRGGNSLTTRNHLLQPIPTCAFRGTLESCSVEKFSPVFHTNFFFFSLFYFPVAFF
ncbi:hypothetical protein TNCV_4606701 [Trichonephila clavipes]|nr:hypothetical protein TNCV_4606701 [Trichonephila clavipes]